MSSQSSTSARKGAARTGRPPTLTRERIVAAVVKLLEGNTGEPITTRTVGDALSVHPTALYRYFRDMDELLRTAADQVLEEVIPTVERGPVAADISSSAALDEVSNLCQRLRETLVTHTGAAQVVAPGPSRGPNERAFTERMLTLLSRSGLSDAESALAYHALVEYVVGSATIDADTRPGEESTHTQWREEYARGTDYPTSARLAPCLYPSQQEQFRFGLDLMIASLRARAGS